MRGKPDLHGKNNQFLAPGTRRVWICVVTSYKLLYRTMTEQTKGEVPTVQKSFGVKESFLQVIRNWVIAIGWTDMTGWGSRVLGLLVSSAFLTVLNKFSEHLHEW